MPPGTRFWRNLCGVALDKTNLKYIDEKTHIGYLKRSVIQENDILITIAGTLGRTAIVKERDLPLNANQAISIVRLINSTCVELLYLIYALNSEGMQKYLVGQKKTTAIPNLTLEIIENCIIPLPPLAEQKRIVTKIEELLPYIDRYEQAWIRLEKFNKRFPTDMQKSLLQWAIQGKLVEQRPEEGTAEELYQQIQAEKRRLVKEGKLKKEKPLPDIAEDEAPFEIPQSWKWVLLPAVSSSCLGKMLDRQKNTGILMPYLRNVNVRWGSFDLSDLLEMKFEEVEDERFLIRRNDLVMCEGGEPGRCAIWKENNPIHFQKACHRLRFMQPLDVSFFYYIFRLYANDGILNNLFTGTTIKHLTGQSLEKIIIPLPPLAEQKRIVTKLEELLPLCERLRS